MRRTSVGNALVTCHSVANRSERQLPYVANARFRPRADGGTSTAQRQVPKYSRHSKSDTGDDCSAYEAIRLSS